MKELLDWAVSELTSPHALRNNQVLGEINHAGRYSLELVFMDKDQPGRGAVELLQVQQNLKSEEDASLSSFTFQVYTLMKSAKQTAASDVEKNVLTFTTTREVINWLQTAGNPSAYKV